MRGQIRNWYGPIEAARPISDGDAYPRQRTQSIMLAAEGLRRRGAGGRTTVLKHKGTRHNVLMFDPEAPLDLDPLRARLRDMDDRMLKQWGEAAARLCSPESNRGAPPREEFGGATSGSARGVAAEASEDDLTSKS